MDRSGIIHHYNQDLTGLGAGTYSVVVTDAVQHMPRYSDNNIGTAGSPD
jgi:hypothetical protein